MHLLATLVHGPNLPHAPVPVSEEELEPEELEPQSLKRGRPKGGLSERKSIQLNSSLATSCGCNFLQSLTTDETAAKTDSNSNSSALQTEYSASHESSADASKAKGVQNTETREVGVHVTLEFAMPDVQAALIFLSVYETLSIFCSNFIRTTAPC